MDRIDNLIESLSLANSSSLTLNVYSHSDVNNQTRRNNLRIYLNETYEYKPRIMLIGEAYGYRGSKLTGIPFTHEELMLNGIEINGHKLLGKDKGYRKTDEQERVGREASCTMVWNACKQFGIIPLMWAAYPFQPHKPNNITSNRTPTKIELELGGKYIQKLLKLFDIEKIIAIGRKAEESLNILGIRHHHVRHPSHGGRNEFLEQLKEALD